MIWTCPNCLADIDLTDRLFPLVCTCGGVVRTDGTFYVPDTVPASQKYTDVNGEWKPITPEHVASVRSEQEQRIAEQGAKAWTALHSYSGCDPEFLRHWEETIPGGNCGCPESYQAFKVEHPPDFSSPWNFFLWGIRIHNRVNQKLGRNQWNLWTAIKQWKPQQPAIDNLIAVTSLSSLPKHLEVQDECLESWKALGLSIISGNTAAEIPALRERYDVEFVEVSASRSYDRPCPRIYDLMKLGGDQTILLINSDIAIYGYQTLLTEALSNRQNLLGLRMNWAGVVNDFHVERWGIDAFLLYPEQVATFPDLDFAIGQTMWDYWVPYHLEKIGGNLRWLGDPYFFHQSHPVHWIKESTSIGQGMIASCYGETINWEDWRRSRPFGEKRR